MSNLFTSEYAPHSRGKRNRRSRKRGALQNRTEFMFNPSALFGGGNTQIGAINKTTVNDLGQFVWGR